MADLNKGTVFKGLEKAVERLEPSEFIFGFLKAYGFSAATIKRLRSSQDNRNIGLREGDVGLAKQLYFRPLLKGGNLDAQLNGLIGNEKLKKSKIRFWMVTDFIKLQAYDAFVDDWLECELSDLRENYEFFLPLTGKYEKSIAYAEHPADVKACEKMGKLYDVIKTLNEYDESNIHELNVFLTRLLFCFFAEDTQIFPAPGQMTRAVESMTKKDGSDLAHFFAQFFDVLDMPLDSPCRQGLPATLKAFPYVNGGLFREKCRIPTLDAKARNILLECGRLKWQEISPVIFGSMFQSVMNPKERHELGAHYTSEENILKLIGPLFLDDLKAELDQILSMKRVPKKRLRDFQAKLASMTFLDPACGSGNFLVVSYRELKKLELEVVEKLYERITKRSLLDDWQRDVSKVSIRQFYGIEIEEFPVDVARVSMWLMEHVMNLKFGVLFGAVFPSIPLKDSAQILCGNALTMDWAGVVDVSELDYIMGNPPFNGAQGMPKEKKQELRAACHDVPGVNGIDYVAGWYFKAVDLLELNPDIRFAFVSTNSICQGRQVAPIWGYVFNKGLQIQFAHQTFKWKNEARSNAGVECVIVGLGKNVGAGEKRLFKYLKGNGAPFEHKVSEINGYLDEGRSNVIVSASNKTLSESKDMSFGNMALDGGALIIEAEELEEFRSYPKLQKYIKKLVGSRELLHSIPRYCLWLLDAPEDVMSIEVVRNRIDQCRCFRLKSKDVGTRKKAEVPHLFRESNNPKTAIVVPRVSSERRKYIPMGFVGSDVIITDLCQFIPDGNIYDFGILESRMHMAWMRLTCGRLKSDYRYSRDLCYNTFPWPEVKLSERKKIAALAQHILDVRALYPDMTLANMYDPEKMPKELEDAHHELDMAVDALYRDLPFADDEERVSHLLKQYARLVKKEGRKN